MMAGKDITADDGVPQKSKIPMFFTEESKKVIGRNCPTFLFYLVKVGRKDRPLVPFFGKRDGRTVPSSHSSRA